MSGRVLSDGKLPPDILARILRTLNKGALVVTPRVGIDVGVSRARGKYIVSSSDPITGTKERTAWYAINVSANDVATSGIMPDVVNVIALFPSGTKYAAIQRMISEINASANALGISVAGGHTEITPGLKRPLITVTAIGSGDKFVTAADAKPGDSILMTKTAGIEGTSILARLQKVRKMVGTSRARRGASLISKISIMRDADIAFRSGGVHAMHDATEGGVLGAVYEMSYASGLGFVVDENAIPIDASTRLLCDGLSLDPLRLVGSGSLIIACERSSARAVIGNLESKDVRCTEIGSFLPRTKGRRLKRGRVYVRLANGSIQDELWRALRKYGNFS